MKRLRRSMVIVPGNVPEFLDKSRRIEADVLIFDLQDAIGKSDRAKREARDLTVAAIRQGGYKARELCVRVNSPGSIWIMDDIKAIVDAGADSIMLSHAYGVDDVLFTEGCLFAADPGREVEIIIEVDTPGVLAELDAIAASSRVVTALAVGSYDFSLELGAQVFGPDGVKSEVWLNYCRGKVVNTARWKGWNAGDFVSANPKDEAATRAGMRASRGLGFDGATIIFPRVVPAANEVYGVSATELAWAERLVKSWRASDDGPDWDKGARVVDGEMTFAPVYEYACRVIFHAAVIAGEPEAVARFRKSGLASADYLIEKKMNRQ
ncbi:MAG: aldolase/citrate lyase family protein [Burkholderiaceae bacterium]|nr:aldolase/citrate lyase family protein [Burkholderiaceae bacterium]